MNQTSDSPAHKRVKKLCDKEIERTEFALEEISDSELNSEKFNDLLSLIKSYFKDALHFYNKGEFIESLELLSYLWGLLDAGARLGYIEPGKARKHFKIEQEEV